MLRILLLVLLSVFQADACLWDRDTLREEAKGKLNTVKAITGWFDRYPARYYEMRLERVTKELAGKPGALDLYDDAGVACSRLGRHDEAIAWMGAKNNFLSTLPEGGPVDDRYRYLSNLGTFHLIRWIFKPESVRSVELSDLETSETYIEKALKLNPDAHFGREKYQLMLIQWLLGNGGELEGMRTEVSFLNLKANLMFNPRAGGSTEFESAREGVTGLIQLGAAWQSIDTFRALQMSLHGEQSASLAHLAYLRQKELADAGADSLHPDEQVREFMKPFGNPGTFHGTKQVERFYHKARTSADHRDHAWIAYQEERFAKNMHPDTHPGFWAEWQEPKMPSMPNLTLDHLSQRHPNLFLGSLITIVVLVASALFIVPKKLNAYLRSRRLVQF